MWKMLKRDLQRTFVSVRFAISVGGIIVAMMLTRMQISYIYDVLYTLRGIHIRSMVLMTFIFCAYPGIAMLFDEMKNRYWVQAIQRSSIQCYMISKIIVCIISSIVVMFTGKGGYILFLRMKYPFIDYDSGLYQDMIKSGGYHMLRENHIYTFFFCVVLMTSLLAAVLTLCSMLCILWFKINCIIAISIPALIFYFINTYFILIIRLPEWFNLASVFNIFYNVTANDVQSVLYAIIFSIVCFFLLGIVNIKVLEGKVRNGEF